MEELQRIVQGMDVMEMIYWGTAIVATVVFCIQTILLIVGFDADADFSGGDVDFDADGINLVSVKTVVCFLLGFGWTGATCYPIMESKGLLAAIAVAVGVAFMLLIAFLLKQVLKLSKDNTFSPQHVVGCIGEVYLRIPGGKECGKIMVSCEGSVHELMALADEEIATGDKVNIVAAVDESTVRVAPLDYDDDDDDENENVDENEDEDENVDENEDENTTK